MKRYSYSLAATLVAILTVPAARADYSSTVMGLNPIAYYRLNETTPVPADVATNLGTAGAIGTGYYINTPAHQQPGALVGSTDTAAGFDGSSQRVGTPFDPSINPQGPFTAEAWLNATVSGGTYSPLSYWTEAAGSVGRTGWLIYEMGNGWNFRMYNGTNTTQIVDITGGNGGAAPTAGQWYHLVAVYDGTNAFFYVNGTLVGQQAVSGYAPNIGGPFSIAARSDNAFKWAGYADEVALYTNALSGSVIKAHYDNGTNASPSQTYDSLVLAAHPILYYRLDEPYFAGGTPVIASNLGSLGSGADGTYDPGALTGVAGPTFAGFGAGNKAMRISSLAGDVMIPSGQPINTNTFTITCWFKRSGLHQAGQALVFNRYSDQSQATGLGFGYNGSPGVDELNVHWNEGPSGWHTGLTPLNDIWSFAAAVYTPTNVTVYLDNSSNSFDTSLAAHDFSVAPIYIGWDFPFPRFGGTIDEVALFDRALSPAEVQSVFSASQMPAQVLGVTRTPADPLFEGYDITMTASVVGVTPLTNQWYKNNVQLPGQTNLTLSLPNAAVGDSGSYTLVAANAYGSSTSAVQTITVSAGPPLFLSQDIFDVTRAIGGRVTYSVVAGGSSPISYQWKHGTTAIAGATDSVLSLANLQPSDAGSYSVTLTNPYGTTNSTTGVISLLAVTNYPFAAMYGNPLAYYRLNETSGTTATDIASGLNGTLQGPIVTGVAGPRPPTWTGLESTNNSFQFDGTDTRVQLPPFNLNSNRMTIVAWINPAGPQSDQTGILNTRSPTESAGFFINYNNSQALSFLWPGGGSWAQFQSGLVPVQFQWNFVALVIEPTKGTVYLDSADGSGLHSASFTQANQNASWDSPNIGVDFGYNRWFNGLIDEVVVYDRSLSPTEIANLDYLGSAGPTRPVITQQPASASVYPGQSVAFDVIAVGALPLSYQWYHAGTNLPGATTPTFSIPSAQAADAGSYYVAITNSLGSSNSVAATLTVVPLTNYPFAAMYGQPLAYYRLNETNGTTATDIASGLDGTLQGPIVTGVAGPRPPTWIGLEADNTAFQFDGLSTRVQLPPFNLNTNRMTIVAWINPGGPQSDQTGILNTRSATEAAGFIINYNNSQALSFLWPGGGSWAEFQSGLVPVVGQWNFVALVVEPTKGTVYLDSADGSGLHSASFSQANQNAVWDSPNIGVDTYGNRYFYGDIDEVVVYARSLSPGEIANLDYLGSVGPTRPVITQQPASETVYPGQSAAFNVIAVGALPLSYQWHYNGGNISGAISPTLTIPDAYFTDAGSYDVVINNSLGSSNSAAATLSVLAPPTFANLTNDLVLHLTFDTDYTDSSGHGNDATPQGSSLVPGKIGSGAVSVNTDTLSSTYNYVYVGYGQTNDFYFGPSDSFSVSFWVKFTSWNNDLPMIGNAINSTYQVGWVFTQDQNKIELSLASTGNSGAYVADPVPGSPIISDGQWHNIVGVIDRGAQTASVYVDGALAGSYSIAGLDSLVNGAVVIGQDPNASYAVDGAGSFDDVGIWRRALTPTEAEAIYMVGQQNRSFDTFGPVVLTMRRAGTQAEIIWQTGTLLSSTTGVLGSYTPVAGATPPYYRFTPGPNTTFFRVQY